MTSSSHDLEKEGQYKGLAARACACACVYMQVIVQLQGSMM